MVVGTGLLAKIFLSNSSDNENTVFFASGVSNSKETELENFEREKLLLERTIKENKNKLIVYFSSCALVDDKTISPYYTHKRNMEFLVETLSNSFLIIRLPQLIGQSNNQNTLINYLYDCIKAEHEFELWDKAYRYVIDVGDVSKFVSYFIKEEIYHNKVINVANTYRYSMYEIVKAFELLLGKKAQYTVRNLKDMYVLDLSIMKTLSEAEFREIGFGKDYLFKKISEDYK